MVRVNSTKPRNQRNALYKIKNHQVSKIFTVPLDESLQEVYGIKRLPVRVGDSVRIISGEFEGIEGKVLSIVKRSRRLTIEEATLEKRSGEKYYVPIAPSKIVITKFEEKKAKRKVDPWRVDRMIERKAKLDVIGSTSPKKKGGKK
ncbi:MAG: 50S ribosomal protein L24 [Promethearchaeota archaeon]